MWHGNSKPCYYKYYVCVYLCVYTILHAVIIKIAEFLLFLTYTRMMIFLRNFSKGLIGTIDFKDGFYHIIENCTYIQIFKSLIYLCLNVLLSFTTK